MNKKVILLGLILILAVIVYPKTKITNLKVNSENYKAGKMKTASDFLIDKANNSDIIEYSSGNKAEMYTFSHEATEQTSALTDYRYIGANPNNYVYFNCSDDNDKSTCEKWQIIGVFEVEDGNGNKEKRIKLIKGDGLKDSYQWDSNGGNDWSKASLNTYLNGDYYNSLSISAKDMIRETTYYLGSEESDSISHYGNGDNIYAFERGNKVYNDHSTSWIGTIALIYPSDYAYTYALGVNDACYNDINNCIDGIQANGWIFNDIISVQSETKKNQWMLTPKATDSTHVFGVDATGTKGRIHSSFNTSTSYGVYPVVYLTSDIYITDGDGSNEKPYVLSLTAHNSEEIVEPDDKIPVTIDDNTNADNNPQTYDGIIGYIILGIVSFGLIGLTVKKYLFR